ncbi:preprotein translocase subunit SecE [Bittarella massiliensis (ex Durand et al. 2017)]|uniref:Protein translocase subunit SecE n=1 Tax=Bittarella massiliensis (ex Durand et al. 2017) TaxID=1720313 RepID=A0AAW5K801_9FIRM|nr:preprotein translocase subunit SecE [Bittarella massiliensis (ex Durand et al. 2017)]MCQ4948162.1 preprotein translocase subunit SecE [Bittarella massiliensis (ex Durand et al. 2017)]
MAKTTADKPAKKKGRFSPKRIASRIAKYFRDFRSELKKIVWPSRKQIVKSTAVVLLMVFIAGVVIWGFDTVLGFLVNLLLKNA